MRRPLRAFAAAEPVRELPAAARPVLNARLRPEDFGYALIGEGEFIPLAPGALQVVEACDGTASIADLTARFGQEGLGLIGDLWVQGLLTTQ